MINSQNYGFLSTDDQDHHQLDPQSEHFSVKPHNK